jgi:Ca2+-dependent lipid-binding protein
MKKEGREKEKVVKEQGEGEGRRGEGEERNRESENASKKTWNNQIILVGSMFSFLFGFLLFILGSKSNS